MSPRQPLKASIRESASDDEICIAVERICGRNQRVTMPSVIVTGGSRGLGLGIARRLAADGYRVIAIARQSNDQLAAAWDEAERSGAGTIAFTSFDLNDVDAIPNLVKAVRKEHG